MTKRQLTTPTAPLKQKKVRREETEDLDLVPDDAWGRLMARPIVVFDDITEHHNFGIDMRKFDFFTPWNIKKEGLRQVLGVPEVFVITE